MKTDHSSDKVFIDAKSLIDEAVADFCSYEDKRSNISINVLKDFPMHCQPDLVKHLIINLLSNSFKHGGSDVDVTITIKNRNISLADNGKGIPAEYLPYIFEKFYTKGKNGTGLGLAFCKMIVDKLKGSIICISEVNKGTTFVLRF